jgi:2-dehydro-3-deoxyphosphooctonate aldolase (KDO 8-P synthase)
MPVAVKSFKVGSVEAGGGELFLIAGPCVVESEAHALKMAHAIRSITERIGIPYIFKASYDKANRTSMNAYRGPGIDGRSAYSVAFETTPGWRC